jgi:hypothetical protein
MGIQQYFIDKKIKEAEKKTKRLKEKSMLSKISSVAIFVDESTSFDDKKFIELQNIIKLDNTHFSILTYKDKKSNFNEFRGAVVLQNEINWQGKVTSIDVNSFLDKDFDLLIDYTLANNQKKQLIVAHIKAALKVGFLDDNDGLYDFMIEVNSTEISMFNKELVRYLEILKLI